MPIPPFQEFMRPVLEFHADNKEHTTQEISNKVAKLNFFTFTDEDWKQKTAQGQLVIYNRIAWAKSYLTNAKLLTSPKRSLSIITQRGKDALLSNTNIDIAYLSQFEEFTMHRGHSTPQCTNASQNPNQYIEKDPVESIEETICTLDSNLTKELLEVIKSSSPQFFERLVVDLMIALGYGGSRKEAGETTSFTNDGGIDGIIKEDKLGLDMIYLQAKRYTDKNVGTPEIQAFVGALAAHHAKKGVFITTSKFCSGTYEYTRIINDSIILIDGEQLANLMIEYDLGVYTKQSFHIKAINSEYFDEL